MENWKRNKKKLWNYWHIQNMEFMYLIILLVILAVFSVTSVNLDATGNMYCFELRCCMRTPQNLHLCHQTHICNPQGLDALVILMSTVFFLRMSALIQFFQGEIDRMEQEWGIFQNVILCQKYASNIIDRKNWNISDRIFEIKKIKTSGGLTKSPCLFEFYWVSVR